MSLVSRRARRNDTSARSDTAAVRVICRNSSVSPFDASKIAVAMTKAFLAVEGRQAAASTRVIEYQNGGALAWG